MKVRHMLLFGLMIGALSFAIPAHAQTFTYLQYDTEIRYIEINQAYDFHARVDNLLLATRSLRYTLTPVLFADTARQASICTFAGCYPPRSGRLEVDQEYEAGHQDSLAKFTIYNQISDWSQGFPIPVEAPLIGDYVFDVEVQSTDDLNERIAYRVSLLFNQSIVRETISPIPQSDRLVSNFPNPFNAGTVIRFTVLQPSTVGLTVFDLLGREIAQPLLPTTMSAGVYELKWDATSSGGISLPSGRYLVRANIGEKMAFHSITLVR